MMNKMNKVNIMNMMNKMNNYITNFVLINSNIKKKYKR